MAFQVIVSRNHLENRANGLSYPVHAVRLRQGATRCQTKLALAGSVGLRCEQYSSSLVAVGDKLRRRDIRRRCFL
jgi:hypothetical protein